MTTFYLIIIVIVLAVAVPLSSGRPDAVQRLLHLQGGVENFPKALIGIALVAAVTMIIGKLIKRIKR
jgi:hypothetical protein